MSETFEDRIIYSCYDVQYAATREEANDLASYVAALPESVRLDVVDAMLEHGTFQVHQPLVSDLLERLAIERAALRAKLHDLTRLRVREMGIES